MNALASSKNLYISCGKGSKSLYAKVNCAATEDVATQKKAILVVNLAEYGTEIGMRPNDFPIEKCSRFNTLKRFFVFAFDI